jgi:putative transposase
MIHGSGGYMGFQRHTIRLPGFDYTTSGAYFVTICTYRKEPIFGEIINGEIQLNNIGRIVEYWWNDIPKHFNCVGIDEFVIMPNHVHGIVWINEYQNDRVGAQFIAPTDIDVNFRGVINHAPTLGMIIRSFKAKTSFIAKEHLWQRNYHDHIIRNDRELFAIRKYIHENPLKWEMDPENARYSASRH